MQETWVQYLGQEDPLEKGMITHCSILTLEIHGQRSLAGYSPWDLKELSTHTHTHTIMLVITTTSNECLKCLTEH